MLWRARVQAWRRGFAEAPPPLDAERQQNIVAQFGSAALPDADTLPLTESLRDTLERVLPLWESTVVPSLRNGESVLMVAHGNALRALFKHIDHMTTHESPSPLEVAHAEPLVLRLDDAMRVVLRVGLESLLQARPISAGSEANR